MDGTAMRAERARRRPRGVMASARGNSTSARGWQTTAAPHHHPAAFQRWRDPANRPATAKPTAIMSSGCPQMVTTSKTTTDSATRRAILRPRPMPRESAMASNARKHVEPRRRTDGPSRSQALGWSTTSVPSDSVSPK